MFLIPSINICKNTAASRAAARAVPTASRDAIVSYRVVLDLISSRWVQIHWACPSWRNVNITRHRYYRHQQPTQNTHTEAQWRPGKCHLRGEGRWLHKPVYSTFPVAESWEHQLTNTVSKTNTEDFHATLIPVLMNWENPSKLWSHSRSK